MLIFLIALLPKPRRSHRYACVCEAALSEKYSASNYPKLNFRCTSGFGIYENKEWITIIIKIANNAVAFDFEPVEIVIDGKYIPLGAAWNPAKERIVMGCETSFAIDITLERMANIFCVIRFRYSDLFGNQYYQDLPLIYSESTEVGQGGTKRSKQIFMS